MQKRILLIPAAASVLLVASLFYASKPSRRTDQASEPDQFWHPATASISGRVVNNLGQAVSRAEVAAEKTDALVSVIPRTVSDENGSYRLNVGLPGEYVVFASKEEDGYPLTISGFHQEHPIFIPKVTVRVDQSVQGIEVNLGSKKAALEGTITDCITNEPVTEGTKITLRRADNPEIIYSFGVGTGAETRKGKFRVLVPSVPFTIEVSSSGYERWTYNSEENGMRVNSLSISAGDTEKIAIRLRPETKN